jgi:hypothetical protein
MRRNRGESRCAEYVPIPFLVAVLISKVLITQIRYMVLARAKKYLQYYCTRFLLEILLYQISTRDSIVPDFYKEYYCTRFYRAKNHSMN